MFCKRIKFYVNFHKIQEQANLKIVDQELLDYLRILNNSINKIKIKQTKKKITKLHKTKKKYYNKI